MAEPDGVCDRCSVPAPQSLKVDFPLSELFERLGKAAVVVTFDKSDQQDFRTALGQYFKRLPLHSLLDEAAEARLETLQALTLWQLATTVIRERRWVARTSVPYRGWKIPPLTKNEQNCKPWSFPWEVKLETQADVEKRIIAESQEVKDCTTCGATGHTNCDKCRATGLVGCPACSAIGSVDCVTCRGTGQIQKEKKVQSYRKCSACGVNNVMNLIAVFDDNANTRARICQKCRGTGQEPFIDTERYQVPCTPCRTTGKVCCQTCTGKKKVICNVCSGRRTVTCATCEGRQSLVTFLELHRTCQAVVTKGEYSTPDTQAFFEASYQPLYAFGETEPHSWQGASLQVLKQRFIGFKPDGDLGVAFHHDFSEIMSATFALPQDQERSTAWRIEGTCFRVRKATYVLRKKNYRTLWESTMCVPSGAHWRDVLPHNSLVTQWYLHELKSLPQQVESIGARDAALWLQKFDAVKTADPVCQRAIAQFQDKQHQTDPTLRKVAAAAQHVKASSSQMLMWFVTAIFVAIGTGLLLLMDDNMPGMAWLALSIVPAIIGMFFSKR